MDARGTRHTYHTADQRWATGAEREKAVFKSVDGKRLIVTSILSCSDPDIAGDEVDPDGLDWSIHKSRQGVVNFEHDPNLVIAHCWDATREPADQYRVEYRKFPDAAQALPVGHAYFNASDRNSSLAFAMIERDILPGVSLEFLPVAGCFKAIGPSSEKYRPIPLAYGTAYRFDQANVRAYAHCATPVNPSALVVEGGAVRKSLPPELTPLRIAMEKGKVGSDALTPALVQAIHKSLSRYQSPALVKGGWTPVEKAMPDAPESAYETDGAGAEPAADPMGAPPMGGIAAMYAKAQALLDACSQNEGDMESSDSPELRSFMAKIRTKISAIAEDIKGMADKHDAKLNGGKADEPESGEGADEPEDDAEPDMSTDDDGMLKAVPSRYKAVLKAIRTRRRSLAEVLKADPVTPTAITHEPPDDLARLERERRKFLRVQRRGY